MNKVIFPHTFNFNAPIARLVDIHRGGIDGDWMQKRAAVLTDELKAVRPEKNHSFIHLITMGAGERYGCNRNGDIFPEKMARFEFPDPARGSPKTRMLGPGLVDCHKTFMKYAHVFRDHVNKGSEFKIGDVIAEAYNPEMHRGELIVKVSDDKFADGLEKLARGEDSPWSMSCRIPADYCSICGNQAPSRKEYCDHLKNEMSRVKEGGYQVYAINPNPLFFDISSVFRPADRIAYGLRKVASTGVMPEEFIPSAQLAEMWGISAPRSVLLDTSPRRVQEKLATMERMAAMEKQIEATGRLVSPELSAGASNEGIDNDAASKMRSVDWNELMGALSQAKICLPVRDFFRLVLGNKYDSVSGEMDSVQSLLPGIFGRMLSCDDEVEDVTGMQTYDPATGLVPKSVRDIVESLKPGMSLEEGPARRRVSIHIIRGGGPGAELRKMSRDLTPSKQASYLAKQYAAYQLAFIRATEGANDGLATGLAVLGNYAY